MYLSQAVCASRGALRLPIQYMKKLSSPAGTTKAMRGAFTSMKNNQKWSILSAKAVEVQIDTCACFATSTLNRPSHSARVYPPVDHKCHTNGSQRNSSMPYDLTSKLYIMAPEGLHNMISAHCCERQSEVIQTNKGKRRE